MKKSLVAILGVVLLLCCSVRAQPDDDDLYSKAVIKLDQFQAAVRSKWRCYFLLMLNLLEITCSPTNSSVNSANLIVVTIVNLLKLKFLYIQGKGLFFQVYILIL